VRMIKSHLADLETRIEADLRREQRKEDPRAWLSEMQQTFRGRSTIEDVEAALSSEEEFQRFRRMR
jgi:hypothetical protein